MEVSIGQKYQMHLEESAILLSVDNTGGIQFVSDLGILMPIRLVIGQSTR